MATYTSGTTSTTNQPFISSAGFMGTNFSTSAWSTPLSPNGNYYYYVTGVSGYARTNTGSGNIYMQISSSVSTTAYSVGTARGEANAVSTTYGTISGSNINTVIRDGVTWYGGYYTGGANGIKATRTTGDTGFNVETTTGGTAFTSSSVYFRITYTGMPDSSFANVYASSGGQTSMNVSWDAVSGASGYELWYGTGGSFSLYSTYSGTSATVTGLSAGTQYNFRISAYISGAYALNTAYKGPYSYTGYGTTDSAVPAPTIDSSALSAGRVGQYYSTNVFTSSGTATSFSTTSLPSGLYAQDNVSYATIYGTPTASGTYSPGFYASNAGGNSGWVYKSLSIYSPYVPSANGSSFTQGTQNTAYGSSTITFNNTLSVTGAPGSLAGLSVSADSSGVTLSGTPTSSGTFNMNLTLVGATDNGSANNTFVTLSVYIVANNPTWPTFTFPDGKVNANYNSSVSATNAQSITGVSISPSGNGLTASASGTSTLVVSGTPTVAGTYTVSATANGASGTTPANLSKTFTVAPLVPPTWTDTTLGATMTVGVPYATSSAGNNSIAATGATTFSVIGGTSLPAGLTGTTSNGVWTITGTPTTRGSYSFLVRASNADGNATPDQSYSGTITHPPTWIDQALADIYQGRAYSDSLSVSTSTAITWSVLDIPAGLSYAASGTNNNTLTFTGTPTSTGTFAFVIRATNSDGYIEKTFSLTMKLPPNWTDNQLGSFVQGVDYFDSVIATNSPTYEIVAGGTIPTGISFNTSTGAFTGIATVLNESYSFTVRAYNTDGEVTQAFSGSVQPDLGGGIKVYNGTNWTSLGNQMVYVYSGGAWVEGRVYTYNGNIWVKSLF